MNRHKYKYTDMDCEYCADRKAAACRAGQCIYIMENLSDLFEDKGFCEAVKNAEYCLIRHRDTLIYIKNNAAERVDKRECAAEINECGVVCELKPEEQFCKYGGTGFICYNKRDGSCLRDWLRRIQNKNYGRRS